MQLLDRFKNVATARLEAMSRQVTAGSSGSGGGDNGNGSDSTKYEMGEEERKIIRNLQGMGLAQGVAAGLLSFIFLRRGPVYMARWLQRRQQNAGRKPTTPTSGGDVYRLTNPNNPNTTIHTNNANTNTNPFQQAQNRGRFETPFPRSRSHWFVRGVWFVFDCTLSLMMAASVSAAYTDVDQIRDQLLELPLVKGRSLVSDALCDDIVRELAAIRKENSPAYQRLARDVRDQQKQRRNNSKSRQSWSLTESDSNPLAQYLESIDTFAQNCQRRRYAEQQIREQSGWASSSATSMTSSSSSSSSMQQQLPPVELPAPVPRDGPRLVADDGQGEEGEDVVLDADFASQEESYFDDTDNDNNTKWANDLVTDQEEEEWNDSGRGRK